MTGPLDFQSIMLVLQRFWADHGCLIWQPYYSQVGAGTMNPATILRVLGPEPWNVAYVEPSIRPDDGRYGENPNRLQQHYQFQVILKPDPGNPQELYLMSLEALGIDPRQHDIRFVEDNWESPALGAWGLGWEVWLDGQEITQFTYFQQAGGMALDPVSVEITYGLDRIAMALQHVRNFRDIRWNESFTCGDVNLAGEQEHSQYYFDVANIDRLRQMYSLFEAEAVSALAEGLVLPAHDYILKCSHTFNVLDSRGAVGVTERQAMFARMRDLSRQVAEAYLGQRQKLEFPFIRENHKSLADYGNGDLLETTISRPAGARAAVEPVTGPSPFLLEIGTEELPAGDLQDALDQLGERVPGWLEELRLAHGSIKVMGTPRRLVVWVQEMAARQPDRTTVIKGPPADRAFDPSGQPTRAGEGFARSRGLAVGDLQVREIDGGRYAMAVVSEPGRSAVEVLTGVLPAWVASLHFDKPMRWNNSGVAFSRPIRWLLALYDEQVIPFVYAGYTAGRTTRGLRFHDPDFMDIKRPEDYFSALQDQGILLDPLERRQRIQDQVTRLVEEAGGKVKEDADLLGEITHLVEAPTALRGSFDPSHLHLPPEVLISVMKKHQRYFPVEKEGQLLPYFIAVRNGDAQHLEVVVDGNEQVIRARFADADFFVRDDLKHPLPDFLPRLNSLAFQKQLGSMLDKTRRIQRLVEALSARIGLTGEEIPVALRAAELCKADLATRMVVEMTSLQGIMGRYYALKAGEPQAVAQAIFEHYLPRSGGDMTPQSLAGLVVGLADRLDSLAGLFAAGLAPTGTRDPFALRRSALGLVQGLIAWDLDFDLRAGLDLAAAGLPIQATPETQAACLDFIVGRLRSILLEAGFRYDGVDAVLTVQGANPANASRAVKELAAWIARPDWQVILPAYARCVRITRDQPEKYPVDLGFLADPAEINLFRALEKVEGTPRRAGSPGDLLEAFLPVIPAINQFFTAVMVMAEDPRVRKVRLGLLQRVAALAEGVVDFSLLEGF